MIELTDDGIVLPTKFPYPRIELMMAHRPDEYNYVITTEPGEDFYVKYIKYKNKQVEAKKSIIELKSLLIEHKMLRSFKLLLSSKNIPYYGEKGYGAEKGFYRFSSYVKVLKILSLWEEYGKDIGLLKIVIEKMKKDTHIVHKNTKSGTTTKYAIEETNKLNKNSHFIRRMAKKSPDKYSFIMSLDGEKFHQKYENYIKMAKDRQDEFIFLSRVLTDNKMWNDFIRWCNTRGFKILMDKPHIRRVKLMRHTLFLQLPLIIDMIKEYNASRSLAV